MSAAGFAREVAAAAHRSRNRVRRNLPTTQLSVHQLEPALDAVKAKLHSVHPA
jgi:hypothetical protein